MTGTAAASWKALDIRELLALGARAAQAKSFQVLSVADAADLEAATAQIIPSDETPGAREARVVHFIDWAIATGTKDDRIQYEKGAAELRARAAKVQPGATSFAALPSALQIQVLQSLENEKHEFFGELRGITIAGMLANPEYGGNFQKIGWKWIGFDDRFSWGPPFGWYDRNA
jgi:gluconate 2-dehydrogenase gamma chain